MSSVLTGIAFDEAGRVDSDLPCRSCQYNLRMQPHDGECPECRTMVRDSVEGYYLVTCHPRWLKTMRRGMLTILLWPLIVFGMGILSGLATARSGPGYGILIVLLSAAASVVLVFLAVGWLTAPEPNRPEATFWTARQILRQGTRVLILLPVPMIVLASVMMASFAYTVTNSSANVGVGMVAFPLLMGCSYLLMLVLMVILPVAYLRWLGAIAQRCPAPKLANFTRTLSWIMLCLYGLLVLFSAVSMISGIRAALSGVSAGFRPVNVQLTPAQQETLDTGGTLLARLVDPNDPNGLYQVVADPQNLTPAQRQDPNLYAMVGSVSILRDPADPNRVVTFAGGLGGGFTPNWAMLIGIQGVGCLCWLIGALMYVVLFPSYGNLNRIVQAIENPNYLEYPAIGTRAE